MKVFLDASAIVAMIAREPEASSFAQFIAWRQDRLTSGMAIWEAARGVQSARGVDLDEAEGLVADFVRDAALQVVPIGADEAWAAIDAHRRYGKGIHEAGLNFGDCFAYACAKRHDAALLFKGDDFTHTDIRDATLE